MPKFLHEQGNPENLKRAGTCLCVVGILGFVVMFFLYGIALYKLLNNPEEQLPALPADAERIDEQFGFYAGFFVVILLPALNLISQTLIVIAGNNMIQNQRPILCKTGAILATIPGLSPLVVVGIPFGIWALMSLNHSKND